MNKLTDSRLKIWLSFTKFILGTLVIGLLTLWLDTELKEKEQEIQENQIEDDRVERLLQNTEGNLDKMISTARTYAFLASDDIKRRQWKLLHEALLEQKVFVETEDSILNQKIKTVTSKNQEKARIINGDLSDSEKKEKIAAIDKEQKNIVKEFDTILKNNRLLSEQKADTLVLRIQEEDNNLKNEHIQTEIPVIEDELKNDELAKLIVEFLVNYSPDCFNASRIYYWGQKRRKFKDFGDYDLIDIEDRIEKLYNLNVINKGKCKTKSLVSISEPQDPLVVNFLNP